jgi:hypothetical protein
MRVGAAVDDASTPKLLRFCGRDKRLSGVPFVAMVQATDLRERDNLAGSGWMYRAALGTIFAERKVRSRLVVILNVGRQYAAQVTLIEDDDVIETLAADRADDAFDVGVLPRRSRCRNDLSDSHRLEAIAEGLTI